MRKGDCCDDFEKFCTEEIHKENCILCNDCNKSGNCLKCKENCISNNQKCQCIEGYTYDLEDDECVKETPTKFLKSTKSANQIKGIENGINNNNQNFTNELMKSFNQITNLNFDSSDLMNQYMNGNITINSLHGNTDTRLTDENNVVMNSNNVDLSNKTTSSAFKVSQKTFNFSFNYALFGSKKETI